MSVPRILRGWPSVGLCLFAFAACCELEITTQSLPDGKVGQPYSTRLESDCSSEHWEFVSGDIPPGLSFDNDGRLEGTPTTAGIFSFTVGVSGQGEEAGFITKGFSVAVIQPVGTLEVTTTTTGSSLDPDGYTLNVGNDPHTIGANETLAIPGIPTGNVTVTLTGIAANCGVQGTNPRTLTIGEGTVTPTTFQVGCTTP